MREVLQWVGRASGTDFVGMNEFVMICDIKSIRALAQDVAICAFSELH